MIELLTLLQILVLVATAAIVFWYTRETHLLRKQTEKQVRLLREADVFNSLTRIQEQIQKEDSRKARRFVQREAHWNLRTALNKIQTGYTSPEYLNIDKILGELSENHEQLNEFTQFLRTTDNTLDQIELVLADFDLLAIPYVLGNKSVDILAEQYRSILTSTAPVLLQFIVVQKKLKGTSDPHYREPYLELLTGLGIDPNGWVSKIRSAQEMHPAE